MKGTSLIIRVGLIALFAVAAVAQGVGFTDVGTAVNGGGGGANPACIPSCQLEITGLAGCTGIGDAIVGSCYEQSTDVGIDLCSSAHVQAHFDRNPKTLDFTNSAGDAYWCTITCAQATGIGQCVYTGGGCTCTGITQGTAP